MHSDDTYLVAHTRPRTVGGQEEIGSHDFARGEDECIRKAQPGVLRPDPGGGPRDVERRGLDAVDPLIEETIDDLGGPRPRPVGTDQHLGAHGRGDDPLVVDDVGSAQRRGLQVAVANLSRN